MGINWEKLETGLDALSANNTEEQKKEERKFFVFPTVAPREETETTVQELPYQDVEDVGTAFDEPEPLLPRENESIRAKVSNAVDALSFGDMIDALGNARDKNVLADALEENAEASGAYIEGEGSTPEAEAYEAAEREAEEARAAALVSPFRQAARSFIEENADDPESRWQEAAQGLRRSSANLAYFMTPEEKLAKAREVSEFTGIPANRILESDDAYRSALSVYDYAKKKQAIADAEGDDFTIEDIYSEFPGLDKIVKNDPQGAALALADIHNLREIRDGVTGAKKGWARGEKTLEANLLSWKDMKGEATDEDRKKLAELQKELAEDDFVLPSVFVDPVTAIIGASSESLPLMLYSFAEAGKEATRDAMIYATAAMAIGAATGPGAIAGAGVGASAGFVKGLGTAFIRALMQGGGRRAISWGATAGMYGANAQAMMGERFEEYKKIPGVSEDEARGRAFIEGGVEAGIETLSDMLLAKLSMRPYTKNVFKDIIGTAKGSIRSTGSKAASAVGEYAADAAKGTLGEMTEEALQSLSGDLMINDIKASHNLGGELSGQEIALNAFQAGLEAAPASFGLTMGGSVLGAPGRAWNYRASRAQAARWNRLTEKQRETLAGTLMLDQLQGEVEASKLKDTAPDVQQQLIREELKDTPWQMAYVDTGLILAQEGGREDVEALGVAAGLTKEEIAQTIAEEGMLTIPTEIYAQTKTSPAALNATTFSEDAEPMAKMKERAAQFADEIQRQTNAAVEKQISLIEGVADMLFPEDKALRDEALAAIYEDPENPAQGWKSLMKRLTEARDEILAPAMKALDEGMGQGTSVVETVDKNGDVTKGRASNNAEWYRRFYAEHGRKPKAQEMIDLARDLTFALPGAPEVEGWRAASAEDEAAMRQGYEEYQKIEKEIEQLNAIKERMGTLTKGELDVIQGMSREGYEVYRNLQSDLLQLGGDAAKAAKMNALLFARHAEAAAKAMQRLGHKNYTARNYYRDNLSVVGEDVEAPKRGAMEQAEMNRQKEEVRKKYEGTDRWMKAPNGEQTNLTEDQWVTVRTDAFKNWFGDWENDPENASKVVDENGEPLVVYHGSDADFDVFDASKSRANMDIQGNFFTPWELDAQGYGGNVRAFFLNIKNPADSGRGYKALNSFKGQNGAGVKARDALINEGFDGVNNDDEEYIAFEPTQIKSATDNNGQFLVDDPNIYHQFAGENAETADKVKLAKAERMEAEGKTPDEIYKATGWFKGLDGKWRFEIPDNLDKIDLSEVEALPNEKMAVFLGSVYDNQALYEAYPWLKEILVLKKDLPQGTRGQVESNAGEPVIVLNATLLSSDMAKQTPLLKMALVHEIQHVIQKREGFAGGGNPETVRANILREIDRIVMLTDWKDEELKKIASLQRRVEETGDMENGDTDQFFSAMQELAAFEKSLPKDKQTQIRGSFFRIHALQKAVDTKSDFDLYERLGGEQEAREAADRAESGAYETMPHPHRYDALIVFGGKEMPYSENRDERLAGNRAVNAENTPQEVEKVIARLSDERILGRITDDMDMHQVREILLAQDSHDINSRARVYESLARNPQTDPKRLQAFRTVLKDAMKKRDAKRRAFYDIRTIESARQSFRRAGLAGEGSRLSQSLQDLRSGIDGRGTGNPDGRAGEISASIGIPGEHAGESGILKELRDEINAEEETKPHIEQAQSRSDNQGGFSDGQIFEQAAWHGSPHIFQSFDLGAIGTGEGAQAHGWGLYFAQDRKIAEGYKERLANKPPRNASEGELIARETLETYDGDSQKAIADLEKRLREVDEWLKDAEDDPDDPDPAISGAWGYKYSLEEALDGLKSGKIKYNNTGALFQVEIPDNDVLLDKRKKLSQQSKTVREGIKKAFAEVGLHYGDIIRGYRPDAFNEDDISGQEAYLILSNALSDHEWGEDNKAASLLLNKHGIKGLIYDGRQDGTCFVVFDDKAISVIETYNQTVNGGKVTRGRIWRDRRQGKKIIQILSTADRSTFLHEMGHLFLMDLEDLAGMGDKESQRMLDEVDDWAKWQGKGDAKKYAGTAWAKEFADREVAILEADRAGDLLGRDALMAQWRQERFTRAWEIYLMEGTAPSKGLRAVFRKFKSWLRKIYNVFLSDGARASKDVEKVMARLIASEEEIERMEADARYTDFEAAGGAKLLKEDAKETFARWQEEAREEAKTKIRREIMKDLKGKRAEDWEKEMAGARARIEEELKNEPIHLARRAIEESGDPAMWKIFFDTKEAYVEADKAPSLEDEVAARMDEYEREADKARLDAEITDEEVEAAMSSAHWHQRLVELETQAFAKKLALTQTFGEKQQNALERLAAAISEMEETDTLEGEETEQERFKAAQKAVVSLKVSGRWNKELFGIIQRMENAQTKEDFAAGLKAFREAKKEQEKLSKKDFDTANEGEIEDARRRAKEALANMKLPEATMIATFRQHEREAAKRAEKMVKAKRWDVAMMCKRQQLYASMCAAEGRKIAERAQKLRDRVKAQIENKVQLPKDEGYWLAHLAYVLRIVDNDVEKPEGLASLAAVGKQMTDGLDVLGDEEGNNELTALLLKYTDTESKEGWRGMTIGELEDAVEALTMLYTIGKDKFRMKTIQGKHVEDVREEIISDPTSYNRARVNAKRVTGNDNTGGLFWNDWIAKIPLVGGKLAKTMQWYGVSLTKPEEMIRLLGDKAHRYIYGTYDRAAVEECKETARVMDKLKGIIGAYSRAERRTWQDRKYEFMGEKLSKENILAMALHLGTESNRQRLAQGMFDLDTIKEMGQQAREIREGADWMEVGLPVIMEFLEANMTEKDWTFVQGVWDIFKEQWPKTVETEMKLNGKRLKPLELLPFTVSVKDEAGGAKEIQLQGGYCPVLYDPEKSAKAGEQAENDLAKQQMSGAMVFGMNRYFTKERVENVMERPLLLSLSIIPSHLTAAIHNNTYRLAARDVYRLLNDGQIRRRIESTMGRDAYKVLRKWATDNWAMTPGTDNMAERGITSRLAYIRRNAGIAIMGFRLWPAVENATNIFPMMDRLGVAGTMTALSDFYGNMRAGRELMKKSVFMMQRAEHMDRDFRQQRDMFEAKGAAAEWLTGHAYSLMELTDLAGSAPLWVHTYKNVFGAKYKEVEKENKENIKKLDDARAARDEIAAAYHDKRMAAKAIEEELESRKYMRMPKPGNALGGIKTAQLREDLVNLNHEIREMKRDLGKANGELDRAAGLLFLTNDEIVSEAERRSVVAADEAVRDVFGSGDVKDLAEIQKGGELSKMMTAFYSYFNAQANAVLRSHWKGKWKERNLTPLGRTILFRFILTAMLGTAGKMLLTGEGNDDKDKYRKRADGTKEKIPPMERALKAYGKNLLSTAVGGMYGVRDVAAAAINLMFDGTDYGRGISMGGVGTRIFEQTWQEVKLIRAKAERDEKERIAEEKRQAKYDKMTRKQKAAFDERQKYRKPPATISYADILRGAGSIGTSLTAARTGITEPIANAVLGTMQYLTDSDGRYEATLKNMIWSALWTKKPVKRTPPEKPEKTETPRERRRRERKERREARKGK